jgi:hypothetical protein
MFANFSAHYEFWTTDTLKPQFFLKRTEKSLLTLGINHPSHKEDGA